MILSDKDIEDYLFSGKLIVSPHKEKNIYPASYIFHLGWQLLRPFGNDLIDFKKKLMPEYEEINLTDNGYILQPNEFILGQTLELITLCSEIGMIIEGRSSLARVGIEVTQTSTFIEPDHSNSIITLEIKNNGKSPFALYPEMKFAKGIFTKLLNPSSTSSSSYTSQKEVKPSKINNYF